MNLEAKIDELYHLPLSEFTAARNALAKSVAGTGGGEDAKRIRALTKPTLVPWAVNQLFWNARLVYQRLLKSGEALRAAQIAALDGRVQSKPAEVKRATEAHRSALAEAVRQATRLAGAEGAKPDADELSRTLESLSLAPTLPEHPGRLTEPVRPAGFEALAGLSASLIGSGPGRTAPPATHAPADAGARRSRPAAPAKADVGADSDAKRAEEARRALAEAAAERQREKEFAAERAKAEAALATAEREYERSKAAEANAREALDQAERTREEAHGRLVAARKFMASNF